MNRLTAHGLRLIEEDRPETLVHPVEREEERLVTLPIYGEVMLEASSKEPVDPFFSLEVFRGLTAATLLTVGGVALYIGGHALLAFLRAIL